MCAPHGWPSRRVKALLRHDASGASGPPSGELQYSDADHLRSVGWRAADRLATGVVRLADEELALLFALLTGGPAMTLEISSTALDPGAPIPRRCTCEGNDVSPPLHWQGVPAARNRWC